MTLRGRAARLLGGAFLGGPLVACLLSCNEVAGIEKPLDGNGNGTAPGTGTVSRFMGDWKTPNGTFALKNCRAATSQTSMAILHLTAGDEANTIIVTPDEEPSCHIKTVLGSDSDTLTLAPQQSCEIQIPMSMSTAHYEYFDPTTLKIGPAGDVLIAHIQANVTSDAAPGVVCEFEENSTYAKQ